MGEFGWELMQSQNLAAQAQASNRDKALRTQQFGLAMQGIAQSFQTPSSMANPEFPLSCFHDSLLIEVVLN